MEEVSATKPSPRVRHWCGKGLFERLLLRKPNVTHTSH